MVVGQGMAGWNSVGCGTLSRAGGVPGMHCSLPELHIPTMSLTLCWACLEVAGRRAGGSRGALQGPSSTHSACAAGQGCCSSARCLLGR